MVRNPDSQYHMENWDRVWYDVISAPDKKKAKASIQDEVDAILAEKVSRKSANEPDYRIFITELSPHWEEHWLKVRECSVCSTKYTLLQSKQLMVHSTHEHCSIDCQRLTRRETNFGDYTSGYQNHRPCIYKITNRINGMVYIGQTTQCFTLRWYQHFFHGGDAKFHAVVKASKPTDWIFEVIEIIYETDFKEILNKQEQFWIDHYGSIQNGYNSVKATK